MKKTAILILTLLSLSIYSQNKEVNLMKNTARKILNSTKIIDNLAESSKETHYLYLFSISESRSIIISFTTSDEYQCGMCGSIISAFEFKRINKEYKLVNAFLKFGNYGRHGNVATKSDINIYDFEDNFLITIKENRANNGLPEGQSYSFVDIYWKDKNIELLDTIDISYIDENENTNIVSKVCVLNKMINSFPVIAKIENGIQNNNKISIISYYQFNGKEYVKKELKKWQ